MTIEERALRSVNGARVAFGLAPLAELPSGQRSNSGNCVLARSLHGVGGKEVHVNQTISFESEEAAKWFATAENVTYHGPHEGRFFVETPQHMKRFYEKFDQFNSPEYDRPQSARSYTDSLSGAFVA